MARFQQPEHVARPDRHARPHGRAHRLVGGAQAVVVVHRHDAPGADRPGEHDRAGTGREHGLSGGADEVDPTVATSVRVRRRPEPRADRGSRQERPGVPRTRRGDPGPVRRCRDLQDARSVGRARPAAGPRLPGRGRPVGRRLRAAGRWLPQRGLPVRHGEGRRSITPCLVRRRERPREQRRRADGADERAAHPPRGDTIRRRGWPPPTEAADHELPLAGSTGSAWCRRGRSGGRVPGLWMARGRGGRLRDAPSGRSGPRRTLDLRLDDVEVTSRVRAPVSSGSGGRAVPGPPRVRPPAARQGGAADRRSAKPRAWPPSGCA